MTTLKDSFDDRDVDTSKIEIIRQKGTVQKLRAKFYVARDYGLVHRSHWKVVVRRAANLIGFPLSKIRLEAASDVVKEDINISGIDYFDMLMYDFTDNPKKALNEMNKHIRHARFVGGQVFSKDMKIIRSQRWGIFYRLLLNGWELNYVKARVEEFWKQPKSGKIPEFEKRFEKTRYMKEHPMVVSVKRPDHIKGTVSVLVDSREVVQELWAQEDSKGQVWLYGIFTGDVVPQHLMMPLFGLKVNQTSKLLTERIDVLQKPAEQKFDIGTQVDLFGDDCIKCGKPIYRNIIGERLEHAGVCISCNYKDGKSIRT